MKVLLLILTPVLLVVLFMAWASYPWSLGEKILHPEISHVETEEIFEQEEHPTVIKIVTWNLGFLFGEGSEGPGYRNEDKNFYQKKLEILVKEIKASEADVVCLQEVDFDSHRSHNIDQARYLAEKAGFPYVAEGLSWEANYIPFPYWPFSRHFGQMRSGGAILSKYPLSEYELTLLAKPVSQPWWYNLFYLHRYEQRVTLEAGEKKFKLVNLHLEAFDKKDRETQVRALVEKIQKEKIDLVTGDFNTVPRSATKKSRLGTDDYENDTSYDIMSRSGLSEVIPDEIYALDETRYFTFPASKPDRRLDYIYYNPALKMMKAEVFTSALSDHLPLKASFQISSPKVNPYSL